MKILYTGRSGENENDWKNFNFQKPFENNLNESSMYNILFIIGYYNIRWVYICILIQKFRKQDKKKLNNLYYTQAPILTTRYIIKQFIHSNFFFQNYSEL